MLASKSYVNSTVITALRNTLIFIFLGGMIYDDDTDTIIFVGSPRLESLNEMIDRKLFLSDIPLFDVTRELVLLNQQRMAEIEIR